MYKISKLGKLWYVSHQATNAEYAKPIRGPFKTKEEADEALKELSHGT